MRLKAAAERSFAVMSETTWAMCTETVPSSAVSEAGGRELPLYIEFRDENIVRRTLTIRNFSLRKCSTEHIFRNFRPPYRKSQRSAWFQLGLSDYLSISGQ